MVRRPMKKRIFAFVLSLLLLVVLLPTAAFAASTKYIAFTSDVHDATGNLETWLDELQSSTSSLDDIVFGGDFSYRSNEVSVVGSCVSLVNSAYVGTPIYTAKGNHDTNLSSVGTSALISSTIGYNAGLVYNGSDYAIYIMDSSGTTFTAGEVTALTTAMATVGTEKPVFVVSHCPLHYISTRTISNAVSVINVLNNYPNSVFLWGHNHSQGDDSYGTVRVAGDTIAYSSTGSEEINFTYANLGAMYGGDINDAYGLLVTLSISTGSTEINFKYKNLSGTTVDDQCTVTLLTSSTGEISSVALTDITASEAGESPDISAVVSGSDATAGTVTWTPTDDPFEIGVVYTAKVILTPAEGRSFTESTAVMVNGNAATTDLNENGTLTVSYTFPAASEASPTYEKVTSITAGSEYVIVDGSVAMNTTARTGSTSYNSYVGLGYTMPTINGDTLTFASAAEAAEATWTFTDAGSGKWYISNGDSYVYVPESRTMELDSANKTAFTYGTLNDNTLLYTDGDNKIFYGDSSTVDFFYPSVNNSDDITLYEKVKPVDHIVITDQPDTTEYCAGETFDTTGMVVTAYFTDGTNAAVTGYTCSPSGGLTTSDTLVTVTYGGKSATVGITVSESPVYVYEATAMIESGKEYVVVLDGVAMSDVAATGTYSSNSYTGLDYITPAITGDYLLFSSAADAQAATWTFTDSGSGTWYIYNGGYVNASAARNVTLSTTAQAWTYGTLSSYDNQLYVAIGSSKYNLFYGGDTTVDLIYPSTSNHGTLTLYEKVGVLDHISIKMPPTKTTYGVGESFDSTGMVVTATFKDGTTAEVTGYTVSPNGALALTDTQVTVDFMGMTAAQSINVFPAGSTVYEKSTAYVTGGKYIIVSYKNGNYYALTSEKSGTGSLYLTAAEVTVENDKVTSAVTDSMIWKTKTADVGMYLINGSNYLARVSGQNYFTLSSSTPELTLGDWRYPGENQLYIKSSNSNSSYYLYYDTTNSYFRTNSSGSSEVIYLYQQATNAATLDSITADASGAKTSYIAGELFDPDGLIVTAHFSDGTDLVVTNYSYSPTGALSTSDTVVTINYAGESTAVPIVVNEATSSHTLTITYTGAGTSTPTTYAHTYAYGETYSVESPTVTGYTPDVATVSGTMDDDNISVTVTYTANSYTITWSVDGTTSTESYNWGATPSFSGSTDKAADAQYTYTFTGWSPAIADVTGDQTYTAQYSTALNSYTISFSTNGGSVVDSVTQNYNTTIDSAPTSTKTGHALEGWYTEESLTNKVTFPHTITGDATLYAKWTAESSSGGSTGGDTTSQGEEKGDIPKTETPLSGIPETAWYYEAIQYVLNEGLLEGIADETLGPELPMTRAMFVTMLYRLEGEPEVSGTGSYEDVEAEAWYADAVSWATQNGIITGYNSKTLGPDDYITREQLVTILYRYASYKEYDVDADADFDLQIFTDAQDLSAYAEEPFSWACGVGIIHGRTVTTLAPRDTASVAETATILMNLNEYSIRLRIEFAIYHMSILYRG